jgi:hypothetical protein
VAFLDRYVEDNLLDEEAEARPGEDAPSNVVYSLPRLLYLDLEDFLSSNTSECVAEGEDKAEDLARLEKRFASVIKAPLILLRYISRFPILYGILEPPFSVDGLISKSWVTPSISILSTFS